ncbi:response regulator transcription factor [Flavonifractor sp. An100]|uniref:response regulator transcription factor n=1 Tax=Flavonifractor sp. An100 TaxID=1965538 RepID=UPI000B37FDA8|nr:response regulator transcription factor [Flavonifractor sp. An100]OUQ81109.1 DNA-binding response regulator [Flavonifractor sp. An100]
MAKILVVDDEQVLVKGIKFNLEHEGYQVETGYDGEQAVEMAREGGFDLIILDLMMPKVDGLQACMRIREFSNVPVIMLTAKGEDSDKIMGFECGADDYITKPFNILELKARVRALLRRAGAAEKEKKRSDSELVLGHIRLDTGERSAWKDGKIVELTAKEFDLMELLMRNPGRVYSRENLLNVVWGYEYIGDYRTVDVHVRRLREKLELDPANPEYIRTKWGVGYYLSSHGEEREK